jgi:hypothetical protein
MSSLIEAGDALCDGDRLTVSSLSRKVVGRDHDNAYDGRLNPDTPGNEAAGLTISAEPPTRSPCGSRLKKFAFVRNEMVKYDRNDSCTA